MPSLAIIGGSGLFASDVFKDYRLGLIKSKYGDVYVQVKDEIIFLQRHGKENDIAPHLINHRAHIHALKAVKVKKIIAINSSGSMNKWIKPGSLVVPDDYLCLWQRDTFLEHYGNFIVPRLSEEVRQELLAAAHQAGMKVRNKGVYVQTLGPRYETKAEIALLRNFGDLVGMTMASEAALAQEAGVAYASLCTVDNYAHGLARKPFTHEEVEARKQESIKKVEQMLQVIITHVHPD